MKLTDYVAPTEFCHWAPIALDHLNAANVERMMEAAGNPGLVSMARVLADSHISGDQALAVLIALDMFLSQHQPVQGILHEFAATHRPGSTPN